MNNKKYWAHYLGLIKIIQIYITFFFFVPFLSICFGALAYRAEINAGLQGAIKIAIIDGLKWGAIIMATITLIFIIWLLINLDRIECTNASIKYYRWIFSNKSQEISYEKIHQCVLGGWTWRYHGEYLEAGKIRFFNKGDLILVIDLYPQLALVLLHSLGAQKVKVIDEKYENCKEINKYFQIDFMCLTHGEQLKFLKNYCNFDRKLKAMTKEIIFHRKAK